MSSKNKAKTCINCNGANRSKNRLCNQCRAILKHYPSEFQQEISEAEDFLDELLNMFTPKPSDVQHDSSDTEADTSSTPSEEIPKSD